MHVEAHLSPSHRAPEISWLSDADLRPSPSTDSTVSTLPGLSFGLLTGRSCSDHSLFFITQNSFCAWPSVTDRVTDSVVAAVDASPLSNDSSAVARRTSRSRRTTRLATRSTSMPGLDAAAPGVSSLSLYLIEATTSMRSPSLSV